MQLNKKAVWNQKTHEGAVASHMTKEEALRRSVLACMLFEDSGYEDGVKIADRIGSLVNEVDALTVSKLAVEAREKMGLRHVPLWLVRCMAKLPTHKRYVGRTLDRIISRPDQITDFLALYWKDKKEPLSAKVKQGLARAFNKFSEYQLAKYNRLDKAIKLRDALFVCHAKPKDAEQDALWKRLINNQLATPDTWEVALSKGQGKAEAWTRLISEEKLGALAFVRNLRNMLQAGVPKEVLFDYANTVNVAKVFPYQLIIAANEVPECEGLLELLLYRHTQKREKLTGKTLLLVDNSASMHWDTVARSKVNNSDRATALAIILRELSDDIEVYAFSDTAAYVPSRRGFALKDAIRKTQSSGTHLGNAVRYVEAQHPTYERLIVITDEQSKDSVPAPRNRGYMMNVSNEKNGVGYGRWIHIDGFSSGVVDWLFEYERSF